MKKQLMSLVLTVIMLVTLLPTMAWAGDYDNLALYDVSIWETDDPTPINCTASSSGNGWVYDKTAKRLTLDGFDGKFMIIGANITVVLAAGSVNKIAYGLYIDAHGKDVTIDGSGRLELGNRLAFYYDGALIIKGGTICIEKRDLPEFKPNIESNSNGQKEIYSPDLSAEYYNQGLFFTFGTLKMQGGQLNISGTKYGIARSLVRLTKGNEMTFGNISIENTTVSAVYVLVGDDFDSDPSSACGGAQATGSDNSQLTWKIEGTNWTKFDQLYTAEGDVAKSAYFKVVEPTRGDIDGDGKTTIVEVEALYEHLVGGQILTDSQQTALDMNDDGVLDVYDLQYLYELAAGLR